MSTPGIVYLKFIDRTAINDQFHIPRVIIQETCNNRQIKKGGLIDVDGIGQYRVNWDNGRTLSVIPNEDEFEILD